MADRQRDHSPAVRPSGNAVSAVKLSQQLTTMIDSWAEAHQLTRADAISRLLELALAAQLPGIPIPAADGPVAIEREAIKQLDEMLDPALPAEERERRVRRLIEGPPEFSEQRIDLPKHMK